MKIILEKVENSLNFTIYGLSKTPDAITCVTISLT